MGSFTKNLADIQSVIIGEFGPFCEEDLKSNYNLGNFRSNDDSRNFGMTIYENVDEENKGSSSKKIEEEETKEVNLAKGKGSGLSKMKDMTTERLQSSQIGLKHKTELDLCTSRSSLASNEGGEDIEDCYKDIIGAEKESSRSILKDIGTNYESGSGKLLLEIDEYRLFVSEESKQNN